MASTTTRAGAKKKGTSASRKTINTSVKIKSIRPSEDVLYTCTCCGKDYTAQKGNFPSSNSILYAKNNCYTTVCKECTELYFSQLLGFYSGNEAHAMEHCCRQFDWYYNEDALEFAHLPSNNRASAVLYSSKMNLAQIKKKGLTYLDTVKERELEDGIINSSNDLEQAKALAEENGKDGTIVDPEIIEMFGYGYSAEEYAFLSGQYEDWTTRYECKTKAQEELYKSLCVAQLTIQRVQKNGSVKEISDAMKMYQELMQSASIKPNQNKDDTLVEQNTFGTFIKRIENEEPICEPDDKWKDVDNIYNYIDTYFLGHLCNLTHVKNDNELKYRQEMEKYTVKPPVYEEDGLDETSLLDKYSDKADKFNDEE